MLRSALGGAALAAAFACAFGCGSGEKLGRVTGKVTLDGKPLTGGRISFVPTAGGRTSTADLDDNGEYRLLYTLNAWGAQVGEHKVVISTERPTGGGERVPPRYNVKSELVATVESGDNVHNFDLTGEMKRKNAKDE